MTPNRVLTTLLVSWVLLASSGAMQPLPGLSPRVKAATETRLSSTVSEPRPIWAQGRVEPISDGITLGIGVVGPIRAIYVHEGDAVRRGQLLAELDDADQKAHITEAKASVELRQAELDRLLNGARSEERRRVAAELEEASAGLTWAKQKRNRLMSLVAKAFASQEALDEAQSKLAVATAKREVAAAASTLINAPPRREDVAIAQANLLRANANLTVQHALLHKMQLRSPIDGIVLRLYMKVGEIVSILPLSPIIKVGDIRRLKVIAEVDEADVARVKIGQRALITADAYGAERFRGVVSRVSPMMGPKTVSSARPTEKIDTQVLDVTIDLDPGVHLPIGLRVDVEIGTPAASLSP